MAIPSARLIRRSRAFAEQFREVVREARLLRQAWDMVTYNDTAVVIRGPLGDVTAAELTELMRCVDDVQIVLTPMRSDILRRTQT